MSEERLLDDVRQHVGGERLQLTRSPRPRLRARVGRLRGSRRKAELHNLFGGQRDPLGDDSRRWLVLALEIASDEPVSTDKEAHDG